MGCRIFLLLLVITGFTLAGLYDADPHVVESGRNVDAILFNNTNSETSHLVEFYSSWCGGCRAYKPYFTELARMINHWSRYIKLLAVECSNNNDVCSSHYVERVPTIRFYSPRATNTSSGESLDWINKFNNEQMRIFLAGNILRYHAYLLKTVDRYEDIQRLIMKDRIKLVLVTSNTIASKVLSLDYVESMVSIVLSPSLPNGFDVAIFDRSSIVSLTPIDSIRQEYGQNSSALIAESNSRIKQLLVRYTSNHVTTTASSIFPHSVQITTFPLVNQNIVSIIDVVSGIQYALSRELRSERAFNADELVALKNWVDLLKKLPLPQNVHSTLVRVNEWASDNLGRTGSATQQDYATFIAYINDNVWIGIQNAVHWRSCRGSSEGLRGYPCSLWMIMHLVTVNEYENSVYNVTDARKVLHELGDFVLNFFTCSECVRHFRHTTRDIDTYVTRKEDVILFLWRRHNIVNKYLVTGGSTDPYYPKIAWPGIELCHTCHLPTDDPNSFDQHWNENEVLRFLRHHYSLPKKNAMNGNNIHEFF